jgi:hypothetical protein
MTFSVRTHGTYALIPTLMTARSAAYTLIAALLSSLSPMLLLVLMRHLLGPMPPRL